MTVLVLAHYTGWAILACMAALSAWIVAPGLAIACRLLAGSAAGMSTSGGVSDALHLRRLNGHAPVRNVPLIPALEQSNCQTGPKKRQRANLVHDAPCESKPKGWTGKGSEATAFSNVSPRFALSALPSSPCADPQPRIEGARARPTGEMARG